MIVLKVNIIASQMGITPNGFGELIFNDGTPNSLNGMTVSEIANVTDSVMMGYYENGEHKFADTSVLYPLDRAISKINAAFDGPIDTVSFASVLNYTGVRPLVEVLYLRANPGATPKTLAPLVDAIPEIPVAYELHQNYPNPFNPTTTIQLDLPVAAKVTLKIYNMLGQEVMRLIDGELMDEGTQEVEFQADHLSSGVYFYQIIAEPSLIQDEENSGEKFISVKKMVLMK